MPREQRRPLSEQHLLPLLVANSGKLRMRYFDAEAFTAECSDVMMIETEQPKLHYHFMERLRDSPLLSVPYLAVVQIVLAIGEGYQNYEQDLAAGACSKGLLSAGGIAA